jgi:hypothetical protein
MDHAINVITSVIYALAGLVMQFIAFIDGLLIGLMNDVHIPPQIQTILLVVVAIALVIMAIRLLGGVFAALIVILLLLLVLHRVDPGLGMTHGGGNGTVSGTSSKL